MYNYIKIGIESTFGSTASVMHVIDATSEGLKPDNSLKDIESILSRAKFDAVPGEFKAAGDLEMVLRPDTALYFLHGVLGAPQTTDGTSYYEHFFYMNDSLPSFTLQMGYKKANLEKEWTGVVATKYSLAAKARDLVVATVSLVARSEDIGSYSVPSMETFAAPFTFQQGSVSVGGSTVAHVESFTLDFSNGVKEDFMSLGSRFLQGIIPGAVDVSGSMELVFENADLLKRFLGSSTATTPQDTLNSTTVQLNFTGPVISGTDNWEMTFYLPKVYFKTHSANMSKRDIVMEKIDFEAYLGTVTYDSTDYETPIGVTVKTDHTEYPPTT